MTREELLHLSIKRQPQSVIERVLQIPLCGKCFYQSTDDRYWLRGRGTAENEVIMLLEHCGPKMPAEVREQIERHFAALVLQKRT